MAKTAQLKLFKFKERDAAIILVVFHLVGLIGMSGSHRSWFVQLTPFNLLLSLTCLLLLQAKLNKWFLLFCLFTFFLGFSVEWTGVHTGLLFGSYHYGHVLGFRFAGIPLIIGVNWLMLTIITGNICRKFIRNTYVSVISGALLMTLMDYLIEPVAIRSGFWFWHSQNVPIFNYVCWFLVALPMQLAYHKWASPNNPAAKWLFLSQLVFFSFLNYIL